MRHAILGPSAADKWVNCPPSARFEEQLTEVAEETIFAQEGAFAHDLAELYLAARSGNYKGSNTKWWAEVDAIQAQVYAFYPTVDKTKDPKAEFSAMVFHAEEWAEFVCDQIELDGVVFIEREFDLSEYIPVGYGTSDGVVKRPRILYVNDYKYGAGKRVHAHKNRQGMCYGLGALTTLLREDPTYQPEAVVISIFQPRVNGGISSFEISVKDLLEWGETELKPAAILAIGGEGNFKAGKHCQFCKARNNCKKYFDMFAQLKGIHDRREMSDKDRELVLTQGGLIAGWVKKVAEDALRKMQSGKTIHGFKLVQGGSRRTFTSEDDVIDVAMGANLDLDELMRTEVLPLTDIEKLVGKKRFAEVFGSIIYDKEYQPKVVEWDDPRPDIGRTAHDDYNDDVI